MDNIKFILEKFMNRLMKRNASQQIVGYKVLKEYGVVLDFSKNVPFIRNFVNKA